MFQWIRKASVGFVLLALIVAVTGCGGGAVKGDKLIVKGKVTIDEKPGDGVTLSFYGPNDKAASGIVNTQADGSYEVMFVSAAGEGNYKVTANKVPGGTGQLSEGIDEFQLKMGGAAGNLLPAKYNDVTTSGMSVALQKGVNDGKNFALKSK